MKTTLLTTLICFTLALTFATAAPVVTQGDAHTAVVCIDPGHTSETSAGTASRDGKLSERHVNWIVALRLKQLLEADGISVVMTKSGEEQRVTNRARAEIANAAHADLLIRLHCDAGSVQGFATFYPDRAGHAHGATGPPPAILRISKKAATIFHAAAARALKGKLLDRGALGEASTAIGAKQGALTGSIFARIPVFTVEMCVLTNEHDYRFVREEAGQAALAQALYVGVEAWLASEK